MFGDSISRLVEFSARLLSGGTFELVVFVILVVLAIILFVIFVFVAWKLLVLLAKGLVWAAKSFFSLFRSERAKRAERALAAMPRVAVSWSDSSRLSLRRALAQAKRHGGRDAHRVVLVSREGSVSDLCAGAGLPVPPPAQVSITAREGLVLIDAGSADTKTLRALARTLPWTRPFDAVAVLLEGASIASDALVRAATLARGAGLDAALHLVLSTKSKSAVWALVERRASDGASLCASLARDAARLWLGGSSRAGLEALATTQSGALAASVDRVLATAPVPALTLASLSFGGGGLVRAVEQSAGLTRPEARAGTRTWIGLVFAILGLSLFALSAFSAFERAQALRGALDSAKRDARTSWIASGVDAVPSSARVFRIVRSATRLSSYSEFWPLSPLSAILVPRYRAPREFSAAMLESYVLRPLAASLDARARRDLVPDRDVHGWLDRARRVSEWLAAWEALSDEPEQVDLAALLTDAFGDVESEWPERPERALALSAVRVPAVADGGLDVDALGELARDRFVEAMEGWAHSAYTSGPVARAALAALDPSAAWDIRYRSLLSLRGALADPNERWLTAQEDDPDYGYEVRVYSRAIGMSLLGSAVATHAKAVVASIRIAARKNALTFIHDSLGPLLSRSGAGGTLTFSEPAAKWLILLEHVDRIGLVSLPERRASLPRGPITLDTAAVARARERVRAFDTLLSTPPSPFPAEFLSTLVAEFHRAIVAGTLASVEHAVRPFAAHVYDDIDSLHLADLQVAVDALDELDVWLAERSALLEREALADVRSRVALTVLRAGTSVLEARDPIAVRFDPGADRYAMVRRFERGVDELRRIHDQYAEKYARSALLTGEQLAFAWVRIGEDLDGFIRGDSASVLSLLSGMIGAYADDPLGSCETVRSYGASARDDYLARSLRAFVAERTRVCTGLRLAAARVSYDRVAAYYETHARSLWPYSDASDAPEIGVRAQRSFVERIRESADELALVQGRYSALFTRVLGFWSDAEEALAVEFTAQFRERRGEEVNAHHVIDFSIEGTERDEEGVYTWRYGSPFAVRVRLARQSPFRFASAADALALEHLFVFLGNGSLLRGLAEQGRAVWSLKAPLVDVEGGAHNLVFTLRLVRRDGGPLLAGNFSETLPLGGSDQLELVASLPVRPAREPEVEDEP